MAQYASDIVFPFLGSLRGSRLLRPIVFVGSALLAAATLRLAWQRPLVAAGLVTGMLAALVARWLARRRLRRVLLSGDVRSVLRKWAPSFQRIPHPATMGPLMTATAFAAYGWVTQAREALAAAERGPAWDAAIEHRLLLDALLLTFEGDRDGALEMATRLERLPLPRTRESLRDRVRVLRFAVAALTRAFAHQSNPGDSELLELASETSPLVYWAMRYAAAVVAIDHGDRARARTLVSNAPPWPAESTFRAFHDEITQHLA